MNPQTIIPLLQFIPHNIISQLKPKISENEFIKDIDYRVVGSFNKRKIVFVKSFRNKAGHVIKLSSLFNPKGQLFYQTFNYFGNCIWLPFEEIIDGKLIKATDQIINNPKLLETDKYSTVKDFYRFINKNNFIVSCYLNETDIQIKIQVQTTQDIINIINY